MKMNSKFPELKNFSRENFLRKFEQIKTLLPHTPSPLQFHHFRTQVHHPKAAESIRILNSPPDSDQSTSSHRSSDEQSAIYIQNVLRFRRHKPAAEIERALTRCDLVLSEGFVLDVLRRHRSDWKLALLFFNFVSKSVAEDRNLLSSVIYNEILGILGKSQRFEEARQVLDEMSKRKDLINEDTFSVLVNRFAAAHKIEEAIEMFHKRKELGLEINSTAFDSLLMWLCRYKHVEAAETLFHSKQQEFHPDIKTRNIILNGWCVLGNVHEAKRFWRETIQSKCEPDIFTYGTLINSLTKKGKLGIALKLFRAMWEKKGLNPDAVICNCIIDALCFKKRIPEALEIFKQMSEKGCPSNVATYNTLIKHLCKIGRREKVNELLDEMEERERSCWPNSVTFSYLLRSLRKPEEVALVLQRMERNGCEITSDTYNLILRLYMKWDIQEMVRSTWNEMEEKGLGPDRRSYTVMVHGLYEKGRKDAALRYFKEMTLKGMVAEPRTEKLVNTMNICKKEKVKEVMKER